MSAGAEIRHLPIRPMTADAFRAYGSLLLVQADSPADFNDAESEGWRTKLDLDGTPELITVRTGFVGRRFSRLERHVNLTQAFIPIGGVPAAVAVARSGGDPSVPPPFDVVRAFALAPGVGYVLGPDVWHSLDRFPLWPGHIDVVMLTARETTDEAHEAKADWIRTIEVDYRAHAGVEFEFVLGPEYLGD